MESEHPERVQYQAPFALSLIICDAVHRDPGPGKPTIIGCFGSIGAQHFPAMHPSFAVFAELTDGRGKVPIALRVIDADEQRPPIAEAQAEVDMSDPLAIGMLILYFNGIVFPEPGEYRVQLFTGSELLLERRLLLLSPPTRSTDDEPNDG
jgi:hypothetical protein